MAILSASKQCVLRVAMICIIVAASTIAVVGINVSAASADTCPSYQFYGVRGSGETKDDGGGYGDTVNTLRSKVLQLAPGGAASSINYPAIPVDISLKYTQQYRVSINQGINVLSSMVAAFHTRCKTTPIVFAGYSQGAHVAGDVYQSVGQSVRDRIVALVMFGDPRFNPSQPVDHGDYNSLLKGSWNSKLAGGSVRSFSSKQFQTVHSYCVGGDPVCNWSSANLTNCAPVLKNFCPHVYYVEFNYPNDAAKWVATKLPAPATSTNGGPGGSTAHAYHIYHTGGVGVNIRSAPTTSSAILGRIPEGGIASVICQVHGQRVLAETDIWDRLSSGGYVYDDYVSTPNIGTFSVSQC